MTGTKQFGPHTPANSNARSHGAKPGCQRPAHHVAATLHAARYGAAADIAVSVENRDCGSSAVKWFRDVVVIRLLSKNLKGQFDLRASRGRGHPPEGV